MMQHILNIRNNLMELKIELLKRNTPKKFIKCINNCLEELDSINWFKEKMGESLQTIMDDAEVIRRQWLYSVKKKTEEGK